MVEQNTDNQYDDDLTVGTEDYSVESYSMDEVDLFEFSTDEDSPISRLKTLVLSIDWEITDDVLRQFNEELTDLKDIWAGEKYNLVYVQALEKISKYIYQKKADAHPNAIKLLLSLYYNLEKIETSEDLSDTEKKQILLADVAKFEGLKKVIGKISQPAAAPPPPVQEVEEVPVEQMSGDGREGSLLNLKAIVLGIDWEITDQDLNDLREEVILLEKRYSDNKPVLILLQGIGTLGAYIKVKKSNAHADAFKVLHLFYDTLERVTSSPMGLEEVKGHLFPAVERFNAFKALLGSTITPDAIRRRDDDESVSDLGGGTVLPALSDVNGDDGVGFQAEEEARALGLEDPDNIAGHVDTFFTGDVSMGLESSEVGLADEKTFAQGAIPEVPVAQVDRDLALQGVDVEFDDEDDEEISGLAGLPEESTESVAEEGVDPQDEIAPALSFEGDSPAEGRKDDDVDLALDDGGAVLQGVDVETEADDDSDEDALPLLDGELAPALADNDETSLYSAETLDEVAAEEGLGEQIVERVSGLFGDTEEDTVVEAVDSGLEEGSEEIEESIDQLFAEESFAGSAEEESDGEEQLTQGEVAPEQSVITDIDGDVEENVDHFFSSDGIDEGDIVQNDNENEIALAGVEDDAALGLDLEADPESEIEDSIDQFFTDSSLSETTEKEEIFDSSVSEAVVSKESIDATSTDESDIEESIDQFFFEESSEDLSETPVDEAGEESLAVLDDKFEAPFTPESDSESDVEIEDSIDQFFSAEPVDEIDSLQTTDIGDSEDAHLDSSEDSTDLELVHEESSEDADLEVADLIHAVEETQESPASGDEVVAALAGIEEETLDQSETDTSDEDVSSEFVESVDAFFSEIPDEVTPQADVEADSFRLTEDSIEPDDIEGQGGAFESVASESVSEESDEDLFFSLPENDLATEEEVVFELVEDDEDDALGSEETVESVSDTFVVPEVQLVGDDELTGLELSIESLGLDLDEAVIQGVFQEIQDLRQKWSQAPLEKTFLQLLSTVAQHIDTYRYESSSEAYPLMGAILGSLKSVESEQDQANQELLLDSTLAVLQWQQDMLAKQVVERSGERTFLAPVRGDDTQESGPDLRDTFSQILDGDTGGTEDDADILLDEMVGEDQLVEPSVLEEKEGGESESSDQDTPQAELRDEIAALRKNLKDEIDTLRKDLKGDS